MKQALITIAISVLVLGGAIVAVFYQQNTYSGVITALQQKAVDLQNEVDDKNAQLDAVKNDLGTAQGVLNSLPSSEYKVYNNTDLGVSFQYPATHTLTENLADDPTQSPGGEILINNQDDALDYSIRILVNPPGSGILADKVVTYLRTGNIYTLDTATNSDTKVNEGPAQRIVMAQLPLKDTFNSEDSNIESGFTILYNQNSSFYGTESVLYNLINSIKFSE